MKVIESHVPVKPLDEKDCTKALDLKDFCFEDLKKGDFSTGVSRSYVPKLERKAY